MRHIKLFAILIAMMVTIFSCQKQDELSLYNVAQTLTANAPGSGNTDDTPDTKVDFAQLSSGNIELDWQVDDVITIYTNSERVGNWKVKSVADDGKANFIKVDGDNLAEGIDYTAVYPASTAATLADRDDETIATQNQKANDNMEHLDDNLRMKSASFQMGSTMSFAHQVAIMSVTFKSSEVPTVAKIALQEKSYTTNLSGLSAGVSTAHFILPSSEGKRNVEFTVNNKAANKVTKTTTRPFQAGKHYTWNITGLFLDNVDVYNVPEGNTWTILDTDATAGRGEFYGLSSALGTKAEGEKITVEFPNLTTFPVEAFREEWLSAEVTISSESVTTIEDQAFSLNEGYVSINLPNATIINGDPFWNRWDLESVVIAKNSRIKNSQTTLFEDVDLSKVDLTTHPSNVVDYVYLLLADGTTKVGPFKSINGVTAPDPTWLFLADIDASNIPEGNTWTIMDTDATANDSRKFEGLKAALESLSASSSVNIVFPNLTTLPGSALYNYNISAKWTFSAPNVTTVKSTALSSSKNITKIDLPKATSFNHRLCDAESLTTLIIAKEGRVTSTNNNPFYDMQTKNIDLITNTSNVDGFMFKLADGSLSTPFKCVNGVKAFIFDDDAAVFVEGVSGAAPESYTLKSSSSATLYIAKYWNKERYNYPKAKWSSSNPDVVSVSKTEGSEVVIKALKGGSATITAEDEVGNKLTLIIYAIEPAKIGDYYYDNHTWSSVRDYKRTLIGYVIMVNKDDGYSGTVVENRRRDTFWDYSPNVLGKPSLREGDLRTGIGYDSGMHNTREIFDCLLSKCYGYNEEGFLDNFPVFEVVHAMNPEGTKYNDGAKGVWYLPAIYQLKTVMKNLQELNYLENVNLSKTSVYRMASSTLWHETDRNNNIGYTHVYYLQYVDILDSWEQYDSLIDNFSRCRYLAIMDF